MFINKEHLLQVADSESVILKDQGKSRKLCENKGKYRSERRDRYRAALCWSAVSPPSSTAKERRPSPAAKSERETKQRRCSVVCQSPRQNVDQSRSPLPSRTPSSWTGATIVSITE
nr:hypothetical protein Iba_chr13fCG4220 [Ipomoea batatas]GME20171.1 hypothetical protein Iba_scaffold24398CG0050 [Ipomoea batatas]